MAYCCSVLNLYGISKVSLNRVAYVMLAQIMLLNVVQVEREKFGKNGSPTVKVLCTLSVVPDSVRWQYPFLLNGTDKFPFLSYIKFIYDLKWDIIICLFH